MSDYSTTACVVILYIRAASHRRGRMSVYIFFFQAEDGIRDVERSRGLGDVYKRQDYTGI